MVSCVWTRIVSKSIKNSFIRVALSFSINRFKKSFYEIIEIIARVNDSVSILVFQLLNCPLMLKTLYGWPVKYYF